MPSKARRLKAKRKAQHAAKRSDVVFPTGTNDQDCNTLSTSLLIQRIDEKTIEKSFRKRAYDKVRKALSKCDPTEGENQPEREDDSPSCDLEGASGAKFGYVSLPEIADDNISDNGLCPHEIPLHFGHETNVNNDCTCHDSILSEKATPHLLELTRSHSLAGEPRDSPPLICPETQVSQNLNYNCSPDLASVCLQDQLSSHPISGSYVQPQAPRASTMCDIVNVPHAPPHTESGQEHLSLEPLTPICRFMKKIRTRIGGEYRGIRVRAVPSADSLSVPADGNEEGSVVSSPPAKRPRLTNTDWYDELSQQENDFLVELSSPEISMHSEDEAVTSSHELFDCVTVASPRKKKPRLSNSESCDLLNQHENDLVVQLSGTDLSMDSGVEAVALSQDLSAQEFIESYAAEHSLSTSESESETVAQNESHSFGVASPVPTKRKRKLHFWKVTNKRLYDKQYSSILKEVEKNVSEAFSSAELLRRYNDDKNKKKRGSKQKSSSLGKKKKGKISSKGNGASMRENAAPPPEDDLPNQNNFPPIRVGNTTAQEEVEKNMENPDSSAPRPGPVQTCSMDRSGEQPLSVSKRNHPSRLAARLSRPSTFRRNVPKASINRPIFNETFKSFKVYSRGKLRRNVFILQSPEGMIEKNISSRLKGSQVSAAMEAETLVKWCMIHRKRLLAQFKSAHKELVSECDTRLTIARNLSEEDDCCAAILGPKQHTSFTESYFNELSYKTIPSARGPLILDNEGVVQNVFRYWENARKSHKWPCESDVCKVNEADATNKVKKILSELSQSVVLKAIVLFIVSMNDCSNRVCVESPIKSGHTLSCRLDDGKGAPFVVLQNLGPHYPRVRSLLRQLQTLKRLLHKIDDLDFALYNGNIFELAAVAEAAKLKGGEFEVGGQKFVSEDEIQVKFQKSFKAHKKLMEDLPRNYCLCCERLMHLRSLKSVEKMKPIENQTWLEIFAYAVLTDACCDWICDYCHSKIKNNTIPPIASINQMEVPPIPPEIGCLNSFEKMFIQLVKAFQVVVKAGTVMNRKIPSAHLTSKVVGRTFHLPLPLELTLKRVLESGQTTLPNQELFILVRGLPTKNRKVWESVVNVTNVLRALQWLKKNNPLYEKVEIPKSAEELLRYLPDTETAPKSTAGRDRSTAESDPDEPDAECDPDEPDPDSGSDEPDADSDPDEPDSESDEAQPAPSEASLDTEISDDEPQNIQHGARNLSDKSVNQRAVHDSTGINAADVLAADLNVEEDLINNSTDAPQHHDSPQRSDSLNHELAREEPLLQADTSCPDADADQEVNNEPACFLEESNVSLDAGQGQIDGDEIVGAEAEETGPERPLRPGHRLNDSLPPLQNIAAMLTQRDKEDEFYAPYTIFPIYGKRENHRAKDLYQMLKIQEPSVDSRSAKLDAMCFPDLFPDGKNYFQVDREVQVDFTNFVHAKLFHRQPQFRKNTQYLFYLLNQATMRELAAGIYQVLNVVHGNMTASEFLKKMEAGEFSKDLTSVFSRVRNTEEYWKKPHSEILSMIETYGPPTFFLTLAPADYDDKDLEAYLKELDGDEKNTKQAAGLIAGDVGPVCRYYHQKLSAMLAFLAEPGGGPLGVIEHFVWRREYQTRGAPHWHTLLWVKDAPVLGKSSSEEVAKFIQDHITCEIPDKKTFPTLHAKVTKYQQHHCNNYCKRKKTYKNGVKTVCRFDFPRAARSTFELRDAPTAIAGRRNLVKNSRLYDLPRANGAERINDYNPATMLVWVGNMDLQYVGDKAAIIGKYISKYQTKAETSHMTDVFDSIASVEDVNRSLWNYGLRSLANRECGAFEAADTLMSIPLYRTDPDTTFKWVDTSILRSRRVKPKKEIEKMDPNDVDVFCPSIIDTHYPNRPCEMNDVCLYDYAKYWDIVKSRPIREPLPTFYPYGQKYVRKRKRPHIIQHYRCDPKQKPEQYFYSLLLLFKPWRRIGALKGQYDTYTEAFDAEKHTLQEAMKYHERVSEIIAAHDAVTELIEAKCREFGEENPELPDDNLLGPEALEFRRVEAQRAMQDFHDAANLQPEHDLAWLESQLNPDQRRVYENIKGRLSRYVTSHEKNPDDYEAKDPMRKFVSGVGGTGKSYLIKALTQWVKQELKRKIALTAPTGAAASEIKGVTVHRLLQLPVEHGDSLKYTRLSDHVLEILRAELEGVVLIVIDEISMVSSMNFMMIHLRLSEIYDCHEKAPFGGINILAVGDLLQLSPVKGRFIFQKMTDREFKKHFSGGVNINLWTEYFKDYDELLINMRQQSNPEFCQLLDNARLGICTAENQETLRSRLFSFKSSDPDERADELASFVLSKEKEGLCLMPEKAMCNVLNRKALSKLPGEEIHFVAEDSIECKLTDKNRALAKLQKLEEDATRTAGLEKLIVIKENAKVMLTKNMDVPTGFVNGTTGAAQNIVVDSNKRPRAVTLRTEQDSLEMREPEVGKFELQPGIFVHRKQFPLRLSYAGTIHKSQAMSMDTVIADIGNRIFCAGQSYVALSRVRTLEGLHLINFDPEKIKAHKAAIAEYNRLRQMTPHLKHLVMQYSTHRNKHLPDNQWAPKNAKAPNIYGNSPTPKKGASATHWPAFVNSDGVSSFANANLQCLLSYEPVRNSLRSSSGMTSLRAVAKQFQFKQKVSLSSEGIRQELGHRFVEKQEQNPSLFLHALVERSETLQGMCKFALIIQKKCKTCDTKSVDILDEYILRLPPTGQNKNKVTELLENILSWSPIPNSTCSTCKKNSEVQCSELQKLQDVLFVEMPLWEKKPDGRLVKNTKFRSPALQTTTITVGGHRYRLHGALFHHGPNFETGHCDALVVSGRKFISADDCNVAVGRWPKGSVDAQLLFYRRVDPSNIGPRQKKPAPVKDATDKTVPPAPSAVAKRGGEIPPQTRSDKTARKRLKLDATIASTESRSKNVAPNATTAGPLSDAPKRSHAPPLLAQKSDLSTFPRFQNMPENGSKVSCYANATLQALLSLEPLRSALINYPSRSALRDLANLYHTYRRGLLSAYTVRIETDEKFMLAQQQCAREFMDYLILHNAALMDSTKFTEVLELKCADCSTVRPIESTQYILSMPIRGLQSNIQGLYSALSAWSPNDDIRCENISADGQRCSGKCFSRTVVRNPGNVLAIQILRTTEIQEGIFVKNDRFQVTELPTKNLTLGADRYELHANVRHHGSSIESGHYTTVIQTAGQYVEADDESIRSYDWCSNQGCSSAYLLIYTKLQP